MIDVIQEDVNMFVVIVVDSDQWNALVIQDTISAQMEFPVSISMNV